MTRCENSIADGQIRKYGKYSISFGPSWIHLELTILHHKVSIQQSDNVVAGARHSVFSKQTSWERVIEIVSLVGGIGRLRVNSIEDSWMLWCLISNELGIVYLIETIGQSVNGGKLISLVWLNQTPVREEELTVLVNYN